MEPGTDGAPLIEKPGFKMISTDGAPKLFYHPELRTQLKEWSHGLTSEHLYITLNSEDGALD